MALNITCNRCEKELSIPGGLLFSPPDLSRKAVKTHLCTVCYDIVQKFIGMEGSVSIQEFSRIDLRVADVVGAERIPNADKLLKLTVDIGGKERTILAGIAAHYEPETLVGKQIIVVANLEPRAMRGLTSEGMLLAASTDEKPVLLTTSEHAPSGSSIH